MGAVLKAKAGQTQQEQGVPNRVSHEVYIVYDATGMQGLQSPQTEFGIPKQKHHAHMQKRHCIPYALAVVN